ncbi:Zinc finger CW-type PWWP domain protein 1 [Papilio machaon]|uniref:Zinc finger CW-type PWWP domain protein 1 n=1 Tax=Papilio machaon TaxID=76193 RepID=A0A194QKX5_PAPMA|nr:Zinc finger CW-type PWWP domain protein 1 [Papilio machaon]
MSKAAIIPTETAVIPREEASQPLVGLSQPQGQSHRERMLWLQRRRTEGLWASCDSCGRWRYLPHIIDRYELPDKWYCKMNPDKNLANCSDPEAPIQLHDEEDLIHSRFSAGSIVWVKLQGWPWWPAMVDDCPDTEQFYWLYGFSDIPTHYHVVFFDKLDVSRAWVSDQIIEPYTNNKNRIEDANRNKKYAKRLRVAVRQATDAFSLPLASRFSKYSFLTRYKGNIMSPTKISKTEIEKYRKSLKRKFDVDFPLNSDSDDSSSAENEPSHNKGKSVAKVMEQKKIMKKHEIKLEIDDTLANNSASSTTMYHESQVDKPNTLKETNSLKMHVSTVDDGLKNDSLDNGQSSIDAIIEINSKDTPVTDSQLEVRAASRSSDEFEFLDFPLFK